MEKIYLPTHWEHPPFISSTRSRLLCFDMDRFICAIGTCGQRLGLRFDPKLAAVLGRMHFHHYFIQAWDASVLVDSTKDNVAEKD
uniref:Plant heme peroxidase family profile domain-containing protein n=1 Tax=Kalanchoe fedtschenkoi TaxID=63787 RepID=A0A7N0UBX4_KALFE